MGLFLTIFISTYGQEKSDFSAGLGLGRDYGGLGLNMMYLPHSQIGIFTGVGSISGNLRYAGGVRYFFPSKWNQTLFVETMYGNDVISLENYNSTGEDFNEIYFSPTLGLGMLFNSKRGRSFWTFALVIPIRSSEFKEDIEMLNADPEIDITVLPISITFGINLRF